MFGIFEAPHTSIGWSGGAGGGPGVFAGPGGPSGGGPGGFPGMFPGAGVSNSGWAGLTQAQQEQIQKDCVKNGTCVIGPPASMMGKRF